MGLTIVKKGKSVHTKLDLDLGLVASLLKEKDVRAVLSGGISSADLFGNARVMFDWVLSETKTLGALPTFEAFAYKFDVVLTPPEEPLAYYIQEIRRRSLANLIGREVKSAIANIGAKQPDLALDDLKRLVAEATHKRFGIGSVQDLRETVDERIAYQDKLSTLSGGIIGIPSPWPGLDEITLGFQPEELSVICARTSIGKTWCLVLLLNHFVKLGKKILFVAMEMGDKRIARRFDAVHAGVSWELFRKGQLSSTEDSKYKSQMEELKHAKQPVWVVGSSAVRTTRDIEFLVKDLQPDVVLVDGLYLLKDGDNKAAGWERIGDVIDNLAMFCTTSKLPIIATTQFNRKVSGKAETAHIEQIAYADRIGQNADIVIGLFRGDDEIANNEMILDLVKARDARLESFLLNWDLDKMDFTMKGKFGDSESTADTSEAEYK